MPYRMLFKEEPLKEVQLVEKVLRTNKGYLLIKHVGSEETAYSNQTIKFLTHRMIWPLLS